MAKSSSIEILKKRAEFVRLNKAGKKFITPLLIVQYAPQDISPAAVRLGYTVTTKIGNAVVRNRVKRCLREAAHEVFPQLARPGYDYVLIARSAIVGVKTAAIIESLRFALGRLHKEPSAPKPASNP